MAKAGASNDKIKKKRKTSGEERPAQQTKPAKEAVSNPPKKKQKSPAGKLRN